MFFSLSYILIACILCVDILSMGIYGTTFFALSDLSIVSSMLLLAIPAIRHISRIPERGSIFFVFALLALCILVAFVYFRFADAHIETLAIYVYYGLCVGVVSSLLEGVYTRISVPTGIREAYTEFVSELYTMLRYICEYAIPAIVVCIFVGISLRYIDEGAYWLLYVYRTICVCLVLYILSVFAVDSEPPMYPKIPHMYIAIAGIVYACIIVFRIDMSYMLGTLVFFPIGAYVYGRITDK
jgi:hypothetical protein